MMSPGSSDHLPTEVPPPPGSSSARSGSPPLPSSNAPRWPSPPKTAVILSDPAPSDFSNSGDSVYNSASPSFSSFKVKSSPLYQTKTSSPEQYLSYPELVGTGQAFTNTFLRGILTSIDSKDPVVANAWLETLLDAIDLLSPDVIKREIILISVAKGQLSQSTSSRTASCRLLGKISTKLDSLTIRTEILPTTLALCQDVEPEVRYCMCQHLGMVAKGCGLEATKNSILPQLVELSKDEESRVRLAAIETVVHILSLLDDDTCTQIIVPLVIKSCEQAKELEDQSLSNIAHYLGRLCHGLSPNLSSEQKNWFVEFFKYLSKLGTSQQDLSPTTVRTGNKDVMPDLVPDKSTFYLSCRRECAFNFPAMIIFVGAKNFREVLYTTFKSLASDEHYIVRRTMASSLHEIAKLVGTSFTVTKTQICSLFGDDQIQVLEAMVVNLVHVIDALARFGVLQFGQSGIYSQELSTALLKCERIVSQTRNWRLHADCLEKFSCLANCISPNTIQCQFIPLLFDRMLNARPLPCRNAAARTMLVILRYTIKEEHRSKILNTIRRDVSKAKSCHARMLFLRLCEMAMALFSKLYFKKHFFLDCLQMARDSVANNRLKLCAILPRLKALIYLPSDRQLLMSLEDTVKHLMCFEEDRDVRNAVQKAIEELDRTEMGVDGVPSMNAEEDREEDRKIREEKLIANMEEQMMKIQEAEEKEVNNSIQMKRMRDLESRRRSESLPPDLERGNAASNFNSPRPAKIYYAPPQVPNHPTNSNNSALLKKESEEKKPEQPFYSASLENLDPSAKEFLVDAGVTLNNLLTSSSMPNLSANPKANPSPRSEDRNVDLSQFLISNEEMKQYEAEYKKASAEIARSSSSAETETKVNNKPLEIKEPAKEIRPRSNLKPPTRFSTDKLQGSLERLAEKWEAKRKNLILGSAAASSSPTPERRQTSESETTPSTSTSEPSNIHRAFLMEQRLQKIKQQQTNRTSMIAKPPMHQQKRLSLTDQVGLVGRKFIMNNKQRSSMELRYTSQDEDEDEKAESDSDSSKLSQKLSQAISAARIFNKRIENTIEMATGIRDAKTDDEENMATYVKATEPPPPTSSTLVVKPLVATTTSPPLQTPVTSRLMTRNRMLPRPPSVSHIGTGSPINKPSQPTPPSPPAPAPTNATMIISSSSSPTRSTNPELDFRHRMSFSPPSAPPPAPMNLNTPSKLTRVIPSPPQSLTPSTVSRRQMTAPPPPPPPPYPQPPVYTQPKLSPPTPPEPSRSSLPIPPPPAPSSATTTNKPGSLFTRLPPPKYRPHPPAYSSGNLRRPLSQLDMTPTMTGNRQQSRGQKSLSAENINQRHPMPNSSDGAESSSRSSSPDLQLPQDTRDNPIVHQRRLKMLPTMRRPVSAPDTTAVVQQPPQQSKLRKPMSASTQTTSTSSPMRRIPMMMGSQGHGYGNPTLGSRRQINSAQSSPESSRQTSPNPAQRRRSAHYPMSPNYDQARPNSNLRYQNRTPRNAPNTFRSNENVTTGYKMNRYNSKSPGQMSTNLPRGNSGTNISSPQIRSPTNTQSSSLHSPPPPAPVRYTLSPRSTNPMHGSQTPKPDIESPARRGRGLPQPRPHYQSQIPSNQQIPSTSSSRVPNGVSNRMTGAGGGSGLPAPGFVSNKNKASQPQRSM